MYGDTPCLEVLQLFDWRGVNPEDIIISTSPMQESRTVVGRTAAQIAEQRSDVTPEWHNAFRQLLQAIESANKETLQGTLWWGSKSS